MKIVNQSMVYPIGFFDGAFANNNGGTGVYLVISKEHFYYIKMGCGLSTNTRAELLALWYYLPSPNYLDFHIYTFEETPLLSSTGLMEWRNYLPLISKLGATIT